MPHRMTVDVKSYNLAELVLMDHEKPEQTPRERDRRISALANSIQRCIEDWLDDEERAES